MNKLLKILLFGIAIWIIPFLTSFPFYAPTGGLRVGAFLFKSIMVVVGTLVGSIFAAIYFKEIDERYVREGITIGIFWFLINISLDILILFRLDASLTYARYFAEIGVTYLNIITIPILMGYILKFKE